MKFFCGIFFAGAFFVLLQAGFAQGGSKTLATDGSKLSWQQYDSLAAVQAFNRDTISALESYQKSIEINPANENAKMNYQRLNHLYIKSCQSFYDINP